MTDKAAAGLACGVELCANCQSHNLLVGNMQAGFGRAWRDTHCLDCDHEAVWIEGDTVIEATAGWHPHTLAFTKGGGSAHVTHLELLARSPQNSNEIFAALRSAVSAWAKEVDLGRALSAYACGGLRVGDLIVSGAFDDPDLVSRMESVGLRFGAARENAVCHWREANDSISHDASLTNPLGHAESAAVSGIRS